MIERRSVERFELKLSANISIREDGSFSPTFNLFTRNLCCNGAFFKTDTPLPAGTEVYLFMDLMNNDNETPDEKAAIVKLKGKVLRTDEKGMAITFCNNYKFVPREKFISVDYGFHNVRTRYRDFSKK